MIGLVTAGICNLCIATSLAEFLSAYPTCVLRGLSKESGVSNDCIVRVGSIIGSQVSSLINAMRCFTDTWK
jgi:hypothetical protein